MKNTEKGSENVSAKKKELIRSQSQERLLHFELARNSETGNDPQTLILLQGKIRGREMIEE